jgi:hypothetical protein
MSYFVREGFKKQIKRSGWTFDMDVWIWGFEGGVWWVKVFGVFSQTRKGARGGYCQIRVTPPVWPLTGTALDERGATGHRVIGQ